MSLNSPGGNANDSSGVAGASLKADGQSGSVPKGINLRKEAAKIDLKQFNSNNVSHVEPIISVMRPHEGVKDEGKGGINASESMATAP